MIEVFNELEDAELFISLLADRAKKEGSYFKSELLLLPDGRWRVGLTTVQQLELFDGFVSE